jgi:hypothetical protein
MANVGFVVGGPNGNKNASPHPLIMVLEPKAFIYHCHPNIKQLHLHHGDKLLVVIIRGGTTNNGLETLTPSKSNN